MSFRLQHIGASILHITDADLRLEPGQAVTVPVAAQLATQPIVTAISGQISLVGVVAKRSREVTVIRFDDMVFYELDAREPAIGYPVQDYPLAGYAIRKNMVERRYAVGRNYNEMLLVGAVYVANLAAEKLFDSGDFCGDESVHLWLLYSGYFSFLSSSSLTICGLAFPFDSFIA